MLRSVTTVELLSVRLLDSPPVSPCIQDIEQESLLNGTGTSIPDLFLEKLGKESESTLFLVLLTSGMGGLQIVFSVIYSHGLIHLRSLGLDKSQTAITFIAGPLSGMLVQPCLGIWSDHSTSSLGRRRPFIALGTVALIVSLLGLAWTTSLAELLHTGPPVLNGDGAGSSTAIIGVTFICCVYIAIQPVQGGIRALIADTCPSRQQQDANAWVSRISGLASVVGYLSAYLNLPRYIPWFGNTQFKTMSVLASVSLAVSVGLTCVFVAERQPSEHANLTRNHLGSEDKSIYRSLNRIRRGFFTLASLPRQIQYIFTVQFFSWIGWYPYLLYLSTYVADTYLKEFQGIISRTGATHNAAWEYDARIGSLALLISSVISVLTTSLLPALLRRIHFTDSSGNSKRKHRRVLLSLRHIWAVSHCLFALCMFGTFFITSTAGTITMLGLVGMSWGVSNWIPYTLLGVAIPQSTKEDGQPVFEAGTVFGLHNVAICVPQILISVGTSLVWKLDGDTQRDPESIAWVLRIGGVAALVAACHIWNGEGAMKDSGNSKGYLSPDTDRQSLEEGLLSQNLE